MLKATEHSWRLRSEFALLQQEKRRENALLEKKLLLLPLFVYEYLKSLSFPLSPPPPSSFPCPGKLSYKTNSSCAFSTSSIEHKRPKEEEKRKLQMWLQMMWTYLLFISSSPPRRESKSRKRKKLYKIRSHLLLMFNRLSLLHFPFLFLSFSLSLTGFSFRYAVHLNPLQKWI